jgi:hypothetical protein
MYPNITGADYPIDLFQCQLCFGLVTEVQLTVAPGDLEYDIDYLIELMEETHV